MNIMPTHRLEPRSLQLVKQLQNDTTSTQSSLFFFQKPVHLGLSNVEI